MENTPFLGPQRLFSLDAFRGLTIAGMILVNDPGSWAHVYSPLLHEPWHGCSPTDLVFPFFVYIIGVAMYFSLSKFDHRLSGPTATKIIRRTVLLFAVGLFLTWFPFYHKPFSEYRIMNVLQRIALAYGAASFIGILTPRHLLKYVIAGILLVYWAAMGLFGGGPDPYSLETNFARAVDLVVLGADHLYQGYGIPFDPEGLFHSIPAVASVLLGFRVGRMVKETKDRSLLVKNLLMVGVLGIFAGLVWDLAFPINKPIWTSSYVLYTAGIATVVLALCMEYYDNREGRFGRTFLEVFGTNALFAYVLHGLLVKISSYLLRWETADGDSTHPLNWLYENIFAGVFGDGKFASLCYALFYVLLCWAITYVLYRKRIFIKL